MRFFSLGFSILAVMLCWYPVWSVFITIPSIIISTIVFYKYFISENKDKYTKGKAIVFTSFSISILALFVSIVLAGTALGIFLFIKS